MNKEALYMTALSQMPRLNILNKHILLDSMGSATNVFENRADIKSVLPDAASIVLENLARMEELLPRAQQELEWAKSMHIQCLCLNDAEYPARMRECPDAPLILYYRGTADLNCIHIINMVGTRKCSEYGKDICREFMAELARLCPDCIIVSGLAYGIDINAHRQALQHGLSTVGVLAHGMDQIYPRIHQPIATEMLTRGGLITEYMSGTRPDKMNFVARNRIVAGIAEATVVVESASKGGSLITAQIANDYNRDVFAFPGRIGDKTSAGCNLFIQQDKARLITSAQDLMEMLGWDTEEKSKTLRQQPVQREMFIELTEDEQSVVSHIKGTDGKALNQLTVETGLPISRLSALLFGLEMRGVVKLLNGGMYRLL